MTRPDGPPPTPAAGSDSGSAPAGGEVGSDRKRAHTVTTKVPEGAGYEPNRGSSAITLLNDPFRAAGRPQP